MSGFQYGNRSIIQRLFTPSATFARNSIAILLFTVSAFCVSHSLSMDKILDYSVIESGMSRKGVNVNPWFRKPRINGTWNAFVASNWSYSLDPFPTYDNSSFREELNSLREVGLNMLRVPIHVGPFMLMNRKQRQEELRNIGVVLDSALELDFDLMIHFHTASPGVASYEQIVATPETRGHYIEAMLDLVEIIGIKSDRTIFETINEPSSACDDAQWPKFQSEIVKSILDKFPNTRIAVTGACFSSIDSIVDLSPLEFDTPGEYIYYTFHYYSPYTFTHQGNTWSGTPEQRYLTGLPWPVRMGDFAATEAEIRRTYRFSESYPIYGDAPLDAAIDLARSYYLSGANEGWIGKDFSRVEAWAERHGIERSKIILGEFGVLKREGKWFGADMGDAARWIREVRMEAESRGFSWIMWSYKEGYSLARSENTTELHTELVEALGLHLQNPK